MDVDGEGQEDGERGEGGVEEDTDGMDIDREGQGGEPVPQAPSCGCHAAVPQRIRDILRECGENRPGDWLEALLSFSQCFQAVGDYWDDICRSHLQDIGRLMHLELDWLDTAEIRRRIDVVYSRRGRLGDLLSDDQTSGWFEATERVAKPTDGLQAYEYCGHVEGPHSAFLQPQTLKNTLAASLFGDQMTGIARLDEFRDSGTITLDYLSWWKDEGILDVARDELRMYRHHHRQPEAGDGSLSFAPHGLCSQLLQQDPLHWLHAVFLRPDHNYRLVAIHNHAKVQREGDRTGSRYVDLDIAKAVHGGRGMNLVLAAFSLEDERAHACTQVVRRFRDHLPDLLTNARARGYTGSRSSSATEVQTSGFLTAADLDEWGLEWEPVPCPAAHVRISAPWVPRGDMPGEGERATLFPVLVGLDEDNGTVTDMPADDMFTPEGLAMEYRSLTARPPTAAGHPSPRGKIPRPFPADIHLISPGYVSAALTGRVGWDDQAALLEAKRWTTATSGELEEMYRCWRTEASSALRQAWKVKQDLEQQLFGKASWRVSSPAACEDPTPEAARIRELNELSTAALQRQPEAPPSPPADATHDGPVRFDTPMEE